MMTSSRRPVYDKYRDARGTWVVTWQDRTVAECNSRGQAEHIITAWIGFSISWPERADELLRALPIREDGGL